MDKHRQEETKLGMQLQLLIVNGDLDTVKRLLNEQPLNVNWQCAAGVTFLMLSCLFGQVQTTKWLLENKADANLRDKQERTAIMAACEQGSLECVQLLCKLGHANVNASCEQGVTPLHYTALFQQPACMQFLLEHGKANVHAVCTDGSSSLMYACASGFVDIAELLLVHKASPNHQSNGIRSVLQAACSKGNCQMVRLLLKYNANLHFCISSDDLNPLGICCFEGQREHLECAKALLSSRADVNAASFLAQRSTSNLIIACLFANSDMVKLLLQHGAEVNIQGSGDLRTALMAAASINERFELMQLLIETGVNVNARDCTGASALLYACLPPVSLPAVQLLLQHGANPTFGESEEHGGLTPLILAAQSGDPELLFAILEAGGAESQDTSNTHSHVIDALTDATFACDENATVSQIQNFEFGGFLLLCFGCSGSPASDRLLIHRSYAYVHSLLEQRHACMLTVVAKEVVVDKRVNGDFHGLYHEPLEQVLAYSGMLLKPQVLNIHEDKNKPRVLLPRSFRAAKMAFYRIYEQDEDNDHD